MQDICALKDLYKILYQYERDFSSRNKLTLNEAMLLCFLCTKGDQTAGAIGEQLGLSHPRASRILTDAERKGLITRSICPTDRRQMRFSLTPEGRRQIETIRANEPAPDELFRQLHNCLAQIQH